MTTHWWGITLVAISNPDLWKTILSIFGWAFIAVINLYAYNKESSK